MLNGIVKWIFMCIYILAQLSRLLSCYSGPWGDRNHEYLGVTDWLHLQADESIRAESHPSSTHA